LILSCSPKFTREVSFACLLEIVNDFRGGQPNRETFKKLLWLAGCGLEVVGGDSSTMAVADYADEEDAIEKLESLGCLSGTMQSDKPSTEDWTVIVPIVLELIRMWLKNRQK
jgi:hypothetical protein